MNAKKLIVFLLFAFLPMVAVGVMMHLNGMSSVMSEAQAASTNPASAVLASIISLAAAMLIPLLAVVFTQLVFKEPVLRGLGISFQFNRWWWIGWVLIPVLALAVLGVTLLMPGAKWTPDSELMQASLAAMPGDIGVWGFIGFTLLSGMVAGATINTFFAFGEEIAWRGFLLKLFEGKKFLVTALWIGLIWGLWHAPIILNGHNYPQHPVPGVFLMVLSCLLMTPMLMYFRIKSGSVLVPAILHGTINAVMGLSTMIVTPLNDLLYGATGLAGFIVFLLTDVCLFLYDHYISKEHIFLKSIS